LDVMIEEERDHRTGLLTGLTDNYLKVMVDAGDSYQGELVSVKLVDTEDNYLIGSIEE